jgi:hypothetical protein
LIARRMSAANLSASATPIGRHWLFTMDGRRAHLFVQEERSGWMNRNELTGREQAEHRASHRQVRSLQGTAPVPQDGFQREEQVQQLRHGIVLKLGLLEPAKRKSAVSLGVVARHVRERRYRLG